MGRRPEPLAGRIARLTGLSEPELANILADPNSDHLVWQGHIHPKTPTQVACLPDTPGYTPKEYKYVKHPAPRMKLAGRWTNPSRILFMHHHGLETLDPTIIVRCTCQHRLCINPHHHRLVARHMRGGDAAVLPVLNKTEEDVPYVESTQDLADELVAEGRLNTPIADLIQHYFGVWSEDEIREALTLAKDT